MNLPNQRMMETPSWFLIPQYSTSMNLYIVLPGRSAGSSWRKVVNMGNSDRSNTYVINVSMNGFIVEEWNSILVIEASIRLCFLILPAAVLLIAISKTHSMTSSVCSKLFKIIESTSSFISSRITRFELMALGIAPKSFLSLWSKRNYPLVTDRTSSKKVIWRTVIGLSKEDW